MMNARSMQLMAFILRVENVPLDEKVLERSHRRRRDPSLQRRVVDVQMRR